MSRRRAKPRRSAVCPWNPCASGTSMVTNFMIAILVVMLWFNYVVVQSFTPENPAGASSVQEEPSLSPPKGAAKVTPAPQAPPGPPEAPAAGPKRNMPGPIRHGPSDLCVHPEGGGELVKENNRLILYEGCYGEKRITYEWTDAGSLRHVNSGKCIVPDSSNKLVLSSSCDKSLFELTSDGSIKHVPTGFCVHVQGGSRSPGKGTGLVIYNSCGLERNQFFLVDSEPHEIRKQIAVTATPVTEKTRPKKVALSILITKDPGPTGGFIDSAAALVQSVINAKSRYDIELVAIVSKEVVQCRYSLERMGFQILERDLPVTPEQIRNPQIAREIVTDGCCGIWELLKLHAWKLDQYDRVVQLDTDILFHKNFDELFDFDTTLVWTHGALGGSERLNGGFLVVKPNAQHFDDMVETIKSGDFRSGSGWRGKCCWVYGGRTIQGVVPYYYLYEKVDAQQEVDRCQYNNMVEIDRCKTWRYPHVTSNHFTVCQKPWHCHRSSNQLCRAFTEAWWKRTREVEQALGLEPRPRCQGRYTFIDWPSVPKEKVLYRPPSS